MILYYTSCAYKRTKYLSEFSENIMQPLSFFHQVCMDRSINVSNFPAIESLPASQKAVWQRLWGCLSLSTLSLMAPFVAVATTPALACDCNQGTIVPVNLSGLPQLGSSGPEVFVIQQQLNQAGFAVAADGVFGSDTDRAVRSFQSANGLVVDGVVGPATRQALASDGGVYRPVSATRPSGTYWQRGDQGPDVRLLQSSLNQLGYYFGPINGVFDGPTEVAVRQFQRDNGLVADGVVGPDTRAELRRVLVAYSGNSSSPGRPPSWPMPPVGGPTWSSDRYVVVIPSSNGAELNRVRQFAPGAFFVKRDARGPFINAGASLQLNWANQQSQWLRKSGFDARVVYFR